MTTLYLDFNALEQKADELEELNEAMLEEFEALNESEEMLAGMWEGEAKEEFRRAYHSDSVQMKNFYNAVRIYVQVLRSIISYYRRVEANNSQLARQRSY